jgi:hypothetical protein
MAIFGDTKPTSPLPSSYAGLPADIDDWSCEHWRTYYSRNKALLGQQKAKDIINLDMGNISAFSNAQWCKYDCDWVAFFQKEGLTTGNIISKGYCTVDNVATAAQNTTQSAANVSQSLKGITSVPVVSLALIAGAGYAVVKLFFPKLLKK